MHKNIARYFIDENNIIVYTLLQMAPNGELFIEYELASSTILH